ncbi:MAG: hypothetical protein ABIK84_02925 [candidate division WOR-3 bacterium]
MNEINQEDLGNRGVKILRRAFEELDNLIKENWRSFTCHQIASIYHDFLFDMQRGLRGLRGTATNFTGLSEFLIFRFLYHQLGGSFESK